MFVYTFGMLFAQASTFGVKGWHPVRHVAGWHMAFSKPMPMAAPPISTGLTAPRVRLPVRCAGAPPRSKFFESADIRGNSRKGKPAHDISPVALVAVNRIDAIFDIEREINGLLVDKRHPARKKASRPSGRNLHMTRCSSS